MMQNLINQYSEMIEDLPSHVLIDDDDPDVLEATKVIIEMEKDYIVETAASLLGNADAAMYEAKNSGRNCYQYYGNKKY